MYLSSLVKAHYCTGQPSTAYRKKTYIILPSIGSFLHTQLILKIPIPITSFASKTVIITGASPGLDQEAAKHIVRLSASKTQHEMNTALNCNKDIVEVWQVNLESADSIKQFVD